MLKNTLILILLQFFFANISFGQKELYNWPIFNKTLLNFKTFPPVIEKFDHDLFYGCTISDSSGNLLLRTDGVRFLNASRDTLYEYYNLYVPKIIYGVWPKKKMNILF